MSFIRTVFVLSVLPIFQSSSHYAFPPLATLAAGKRRSLSEPSPRHAEERTSEGRTRASSKKRQQNNRKKKWKKRQQQEMQNEEGWINMYRRIWFHRRNLLYGVRSGRYVFIRPQQQDNHAHPCCLLWHCRCLMKKIDFSRLHVVES